MGVLFLLLVFNVLTIVGSVLTGYQAHEVASYLALNVAVVAACVGMFAMNGTKILYDMITGVRKLPTGEIDDRKSE